MPSGKLRAEGEDYGVVSGEVTLRVTLRHFTKLYWTLRHDVEQAFREADNASDLFREWSAPQSSAHREELRVTPAR
jgi:hypothetical protein